MPRGLTRLQRLAAAGAVSRAAGDRDARAARSDAGRAAGRRAGCTNFGTAARPERERLQLHASRSAAAAARSGAHRAVPRRRRRILRDHEDSRSWPAVRFSRRIVTARRQCVISRRMADVFWPGEDPIGRPIQIGGAAGDDRRRRRQRALADARAARRSRKCMCRTRRRTVRSVTYVLESALDVGAAAARRTRQVVRPARCAAAAHRSGPDQRPRR